MVFDKAYHDYRLFGQWTARNVFFVTPQKDNAVYQVTNCMQSQRAKKGIPGVYGEKIITISYREDKEEKELPLRQVFYQDEKNRRYVFISNNLTLKAEEIALIYKKRWGIEILLKKMKQNFQLHYFYGENENAIRTQIWCRLITQLLLAVIQKTAISSRTVRDYFPYCPLTPQYVPFGIRRFVRIMVAVSQQDGLRYLSHPLTQLLLPFTLGFQPTLKQVVLLRGSAVIVSQ